MFVLSSFSNGLRYWSVNHTLIYENFELRVYLEGIIWNKYMLDFWFMSMIIVDIATPDL